MIFYIFSENRHTLTLNLNRKESKKRKENYGNYKGIQNVISSDSESEENEGNRKLLENTNNEKTSHFTYANDLQKSNYSFTITAIFLFS